jgi:hypothetical protein
LAVVGKIIGKQIKERKVRPHLLAMENLLMEYHSEELVADEKSWRQRQSDSYGRTIWRFDSNRKVMTVVRKVE